MASDSIFLSGWEYNRVLAPEPTTPCSSALPASVLWSGCAQFWLFKNVYCTVEAFNGDYANYENLGWTSGYIFGELKRRGFLKPVDLLALCQEDRKVRERLYARHALLRSAYNESTIRQLLDAGLDGELEHIKLKLLAPVFERLNCVHNVSPNSINSWIPHRSANQQDCGTDSPLSLLADGVARATDEFRAGAKLCRPPGTGLPVDVVKAQRAVE